MAALLQAQRQRHVGLHVTAQPMATITTCSLFAAAIFSSAAASATATDLHRQGVGEKRTNGELPHARARGPIRLQLGCNPRNHGVRDSTSRGTGSSHFTDILTADVPVTIDDSVHCLNLFGFGP
jgi:hypothetical protein